MSAADEAIKQCRTIFLAGSLAVLTWHLTLPSAAQVIRNLELARHQVSFNSLTTLAEDLSGLGEIFDEELEDLDVGEQLSGVYIEHPPAAPQGGEYIEEIDFTIEPVFLEQTKLFVSLRLTEVVGESPSESRYFRVFSIETRSSTALPITEYQLIRHESRWHVCHGNTHWGLRRLINGAYRASTLPFNNAEFQIERLRSGESESEFIRQTEQSRFKIANIELNPSFFYCSMGWLYAGMGVWLLGSISVLSNPGITTDSPWVVVQHPKGLLRFSTIPVRYIVLLLWISLPISVVWVQLSQSIVRETVPMFMLYSSVSGSILAAFAHLALSISLRRVSASS